MKGQRIRRVKIWLVTALFLLACVSPLIVASPATQTPLAPGMLGTLVAETAVAAQTRTATFLPPSLTPTLTRTPSLTPTLTTPTPTFFFSLATFTVPATETDLPVSIPGDGSGDGSADGGGDSIFTGREWTCRVTSKSPPNGAIINPGTSFYAFITFLNTGTKTWTNNGVDFVYVSGFRHDGKRIQDLPSTITPGNRISLKILFTAPKKPNLYKATWSLKVGNNPFCGVRISFEVK